MVNVLGTKISASTVAKSIGMAVGLNIIGRKLFIEGTKLLSRGTLSATDTLARSASGVATAGVRTYILGMLAIEISKTDCQALKVGVANRVVNSAEVD
jgi:hypothetical protein